MKEKEKFKEKTKENRNNNHKPKLRIILSIALLIVTLGLIIYYIYNHANDFKQIKFVNPYFIVILIIISLINVLFSAVLNKIILSTLDTKIKLSESYALSIITGFYNYIMPFRGGMVARAVYLKKKHNFSYTNFIGTLGAYYILVFFTASLIGLITTYLLYQTSGIFNILILLIFVCAFIPLLLIIILSPRFPETKNLFINQFIKVINSWNQIKSNKKILFYLTIITLASFLIGAFSTYIAYSLFGINLNYIKCLYLAAIGNLGIIIAITPAGLGIGEAIAVFSAYTIGITPTESLSAAILGRVVGVIVLFILGPIFSYYLLKYNPKKK